MKTNNKKLILIFMAVIGTLMFFAKGAYAAPSTTDLPQLNISLGDGSGSPENYVSSIKILIFFTIIALMPSILIMVTSFTRIIVVLSFLKGAIGVQQSIPNQILIGLALFLTLFIMRPVYMEMNEKGIQPYLNNEITQEVAFEQAGKPLKEFLADHTNQKDLQLFVEISGVDSESIQEPNDVSFVTLIPAFAISELKIAFLMGFLIYLPFIIIDIVVASILMSMGMFMLPPTTMSLPFKLILFVMVNGWYLLVETLIKSF